MINQGCFEFSVVEPQGWPSRDGGAWCFFKWWRSGNREILPVASEEEEARPDLLLQRFALRWTNRGGSETLAGSPLHQSPADTDACSSSEWPSARVSVRDSFILQINYLRGSIDLLEFITANCSASECSFAWVGGVWGSVHGGTFLNRANDLSLIRCWEM